MLQTSLLSFVGKACFACKQALFVNVYLLALLCVIGTEFADAILKEGGISYGFY